MTISVDSNGAVHADYAHASRVGDHILEACCDEQVGYTLIGAAISIARLANPDTRLSDEEEIKFVGDFLGWVDAYFMPVKDGE